MKKGIALVMVLALVLALAGCGAREDAQTNSSPAPDQNGVLSPLSPDDANLDDNLDDNPTGLPAAAPQDQVGADEPTDQFGDEPLDGLDGADDLDEDPLSAPTPTPAPTSAPVVGLALKDYQYETYNYTDMGISMEYPSHWTIDETGDNTVSFTEPVNSGIAMRLALSVKGYEDKLATAQAKQEFNNYLNTIKASYDKFQKGKIDTKGNFMNRRAWACTYKAQQNGTIVRGYVIMTNVEASKQIVVLHFSAPKNKYNKNSRSMYQKVMYSVKRLTGDA